MAPRIACFLAVILCACGGGTSGPDTDGGPATPAVWTNVDKCNQVCGAYCAVRQRCDGTPRDVCRMDIDDANGGTCTERAPLFDEVSQEQVQRCMAALAQLSCAQFERMFNTGEGVPAECQGITS